MPSHEPAPDRLARFVPGACYHVYNRSDKPGPLFQTEDDLDFFMGKYKLYLGPYVDTFAWCLLEDRFHLCLGIRSMADITEAVLDQPEFERTTAQHQFLDALPAERDVHTLVERQFLRLFTAYATMFNKRLGRSGNLFRQPFGHMEIPEKALPWLLYYLHVDTVRAAGWPDFKEYPWSSYALLASRRPTYLRKKEVIKWFGGMEEFLAFHEQKEMPAEFDFLKMED